MLFKDSIVIDASPDKVWKYVGSPDLWSQFNAKVDGCEQTDTQGWRIGAVYTMGFRMEGKTAPTRCQIVDLRPCKIIQVQSIISNPGKPAASARVCYELEDLGARTRVRERVEIGFSNLGIGLRAIIWLISRFGYRAGESTLLKLKRIVEADSTRFDAVPVLSNPLAVQSPPPRVVEILTPATRISSWRFLSLA